MKILIVEDDAGLRAILADLFERSAHYVRATHSGTCALEILRHWPADVVLTDLNLPGVPGEDIAQAAAALPCRPRVVAMSAEKERLDRVRPVADAVLLKPFHLEELLRLVELFH